MDLPRAALITGGLIAAVTFLPFTLAHGPTSYNIEHEIGPPFDLFLLAPAGVVVASTTRLRGPARAVLVALAFAYCAATAIGLVPLETSDSFDGYRIFGLIAYAGTGLLWAAFGALSGGRGRSRTRQEAFPS